MNKQVLLLCLFACLIAGQQYNNRTIIGIYSQPSEYGQFSSANYSYIAASYIKYVEGAGAQAVVIPYDASFEYLDLLFSKINGLLFPGGDVEFEDSTGPQESIFLRNAVYLIQKAKNATDNGDYFPVWGTCLGFQLINYIESGLNATVLYTTVSDTASHPIENVDLSSKLFSQMPANLLNWAISQPSLYYHHSTYVPLYAYQNGTKLAANMKVTSTATNAQGYKFVNSVESYKYPIFGSQFHAEKNLYEWKINPPHDPMSCSVTQYFANFFVTQARLNKHSFNGTADENKYLIYQYPVYDFSDSSFTQVYIIPNFSNSTSTTNSTNAAPFEKPTREKFLF